MAPRGTTSEPAELEDVYVPPPRRRWCEGGHVVPADAHWEECSLCGNCRSGLPPHVDVAVAWPVGADFEDRRSSVIWVNARRPKNPTHLFPPVFGRDPEKHAMWWRQLVVADLLAKFFGLFVPPVPAKPKRRRRS